MYCSVLFRICPVQTHAARVSGNVTEEKEMNDYGETANETGQQPASQS